MFEEYTSKVLGQNREEKAVFGKTGGKEKQVRQPPPAQQAAAVHDKLIGYIVMDTAHTTMAVVSSRHRDILYNDVLQCAWMADLHKIPAKSLERQKKQQMREHLRNMCEKADRLFVAHDKVKVEALIVAGRGGTKDDLVARLSPKLKRIVSQVITTTDVGVDGLEEAIRKTKYIAKEMDQARNQGQLEKFFKELKEGQEDRVSYGEDDVKAALEARAARCVLVCEGCPCFSWMMEKCPMYGTEVMVIDCSSEDAAVLREEFQGVGAIHRYSFFPPSYYAAQEL